MDNASLLIFISCLILLQAWIVKIYVKTWIFPACIYGIFWFAYTFIPLVTLPRAHVDLYAVVYIFVTCVLVSLTATFFNWSLAFDRCAKLSIYPRYRSNFLGMMFYSFGVISVLATVLNWQLQGFAFYDVLFNLLDVSNQYLAKRYSGELTTNLLSQLSTVLGYPAAILGGILFSASAGRDGRFWIIVISLLPSLLVMLVEAAKGTLLLALVLFWSGVLIHKLSIGDRKLISFGKLFKFLPLLLVIFSALVFSFLARGIDTDEGIGFVFDRLHYYFVSYSSGHFFAFSDWLSNFLVGGSKMSYSSIEGSNGFYTFMAAFDFFGTRMIAPQGVYEEYFYISDMLQTNIYTHYRGLIQDFGLFGSLLVMCAFGVIVHFSFYRLLVSRQAVFSVSLFAHFVGYVYTSFIISLLIWKSVYASFLIVSLVLYIDNLIGNSRSRNRSTS